MHAIDYADKLRDANAERQLAKTLRSKPEDERFSFIVEMLEVQFMVALELANSCLQKPTFLEKLLEQCIAISKDVSMPRIWLEKLLPRVGFRKVVAILNESLDAHPVAVAGSIYFLLRLVGNEDEVSQKAFDELFESAKAKSSNAPALKSYLEKLGHRSSEPFRYFLL